jgi:hypothetical protein
VTAVGTTGGVAAALTSTLGASAMPSMVAFMQLLQYAQFLLYLNIILPAIM